MGLFWNKKSSNDERKLESQVEEQTLPDDLQDYLTTKESQLSNREFKELLRRQSANAEASKEAEKASTEDHGQNYLDLVQGTNKEGEENEIKLPNAISTIKEMKRPKEYKNFEFDKYRRENDEKESVLINCSEIQNAFYKCLNKQTIWDRISAVTSLNSDDCTKLADFFMACTDIQKKAFLMFDYSTLQSIDEVKSASKQIDYSFSKSFQSIEDVQNKEKFMDYTKELRRQRELFFEKYGK